MKLVCFTSVLLILITVHAEKVELVELVVNGCLLTEELSQSVEVEKCMITTTTSTVFLDTQVEI